MSVTGQADGPPTKTGHASVDYLTGVKAAQAALAALVRRLRTGEGQHIDIAMVDCALSVTEDDRCRTFGATQHEFGCLDLGRGQQVIGPCIA